jgi:hypothetical protein
VVETAGIDGDLIPPANGVEALPRAMSLAGVQMWTGLVERPVNLMMAIRGFIPEGGESNGQDNHHGGQECVAMVGVGGGLECPVSRF